MPLLHEAAQGAHRELDRLATDCLRLAHRRKKTTVERLLAAQVVEADGHRTEATR